MDLYEKVENISKITKGNKRLSNHSVFSTKQSDATSHHSAANHESPEFFCGASTSSGSPQ
jgi:hypothetical protein